MTLKNAVVKILKEYVILEKLKDEFQVVPTSKDEAEPFIRKHYIGAWPSGVKRIYGIYQKSSENRIVGIIIYGVPFHTVPRFLEPEVKYDETIELKRLFIDDIGVKNIESFAIGQSLKLLKMDEPQIKVVITFADDLKGHKGTVYQATNAIYLGNYGMGKHKYIYIIGGNENAIKNKIQRMVQQYPKKMGETITYHDIGHGNPQSSWLWFWTNDGEEFTVIPTLKGKSHYATKINSDFQGRFDPDKNIVSIVDKNAYSKDDGSTTEMKNVPHNLLRRLKYQFGDDVEFKTFFEENMIK